MAHVRFTPAVLKELAEFPRVIRERFAQLFGRLTAWPTVSGGRELSGSRAGWARLRTNHYRVRFRIEGDTIILDKIGQRSDFYED